MGDDYYYKALLAILNDYGQLHRGDAGHKRDCSVCLLLSHIESETLFLLKDKTRQHGLESERAGGASHKREVCQ